MSLISGRLVLTAGGGGAAAGLSHAGSAAHSASARPTPGSSCDIEVSSGAGPDDTIRARGPRVEARGHSTALRTWSWSPRQTVRTATTDAAAGCTSLPERADWSVRGQPARHLGRL